MMITNHLLGYNHSALGGEKKVNYDKPQSALAIHS